MKGLPKAENYIWSGVNLLRIPQLAAGLACERISYSAANWNPQVRFKAEGDRYDAQDPESPAPNGEDRNRAA